MLSNRILKIWNRCGNKRFYQFWHAFWMEIFHRLHDRVYTINRVTLALGLVKNDRPSLLPSWCWYQPKYFKWIPDIGGQHCPCPVLISFFMDIPENSVPWLFAVRILSGFKKSCPLSVCPTEKVRDRAVRTFTVLVHLRLMATSDG